MKAKGFQGAKSAVCPGWRAVVYRGKRPCARQQVERSALSQLEVTFAHSPVSKAKFAQTSAVKRWAPLEASATWNTDASVLELLEGRYGRKRKERRKREKPCSPPQARVAGGPAVSAVSQAAANAAEPRARNALAPLGRRAARWRLAERAIPHSRGARAAARAEGRVA